MPRPVRIPPGLSFWDDDNPSKYDVDPHSFGLDSNADRHAQRLIATLKHPDIEVDLGPSIYAAGIIEDILHRIITEQQPLTLEFISQARWIRGDGDISGLHGIVLRNAKDTVLLLAHGITLHNSSSRAIRTRIFKLFSITDNEQQSIENSAWGRTDYSVMIALPLNRL